MKKIKRYRLPVIKIVIGTYSIGNIASNIVITTFGAG